MKGEGKKDVKKKIAKVDSETDSESETLGRVREETVRKMNHLGTEVKKEETAEIKMAALDHGIKSKISLLELLVDTGVNKTILSEAQWHKLRPEKGERAPSLKKSRMRFTPFGMDTPVRVYRPK